MYYFIISLGLVSALSCLYPTDHVFVGYCEFSTDLFS